MELASFVTPWSGGACRHIPDGSPFGPLDTRFAARSQTNRWNVAGEPTLYLVSDHRVLVAEFARHFAVDRSPALRREAVARRIFDFQVRLDRVIDLRDPKLLDLLALPSRSDRFLDKQVARATAGFLRHTMQVEAVLAPSMAFLDDPGRWVMALFLERIEGGLAGAVTRIESDGLFRVEDG